MCACIYSAYMRIVLPRRQGVDVNPHRVSKYKICGYGIYVVVQRKELSIGIQCRDVLTLQSRRHVEKRGIF